jgi:hypothetical protein
MANVYVSNITPAPIAKYTKHHVTPITQAHCVLPVTEAILTELIEMVHTMRTFQPVNPKPIITIHRNATHGDSNKLQDMYSIQLFTPVQAVFQIVAFCYFPSNIYTSTVLLIDLYIKAI